MVDDLEPLPIAVDASIREHLVAVDDAAKEFTVSVPTLYRYMRKGWIKRYQWLPDRRRFVDRRELERLFEPREVEA